jgi:hypothetical protein
MMRKRSALVLALGATCGAPLAHAQADNGTPDLELLEYLGSWQAADEEWLAVAEWDKNERAAQPESEGDVAERRKRPRKKDDDDAGT